MLRLSDVTTLPSIVSETTGDYPARSVAVDCERYRRRRCPQVIVYMNGAGLRRLRATTAMRRVSRSRRSRGGSDGPRRPSRRTCTTRLMLTKGPAGNGRPSQEVASSGVTRPPRHHEETSFPDGRCSALGWLSSTAGRLGVLMLDRVTERRRAAQLARHYRDQEGLSIAEIARRLGRAEATIKAYLYDPTGDKARAVKARYRGVCRGCGAPTAPRNGKGDAYAYCKRCHPGAIAPQWTRERVREAMRAWRARYGAAPSSYDWSRTHARRRGGEALKRLQAGEWPAPSTVIDLYGSWAAAVADAFGGA